MKRVLVLSSQAFSLLHFRADMLVEMSRAGYEVHAAAPDPDDHWDSELAQYNTTYHHIQMQRTGLNPVNDIKGFFSIVKIIKQIQPEIVFCYQAKTVIYGLLAAWCCGVKRRYALIAGLGSAFRNSSNGMKAKVLKELLSIEYKVSLSTATKVFFQNRDDSAEFVRAGLVKQKKIDYMNGSGVNSEQFAQTSLPEENSFLIVSRLIKDKGIIEYLEAAKEVKKKYPEAKFRVIGYYDQNPSALQPSDLAQYFDNGIAEYVGKQDNVYPYLQQSRIYVLPSYHEGTPKSVLEAMATGRPILTTDAPGCRETVANERNGFLVPVGDSHSLADKMMWCIENPQTMESFGAESRRMVEEKFDVKKVNHALLKSMGMK